MFSRQNIWFQVAVALVTAFLIWLACGESAEAVDCGYYYVEYEGVPFSFYIGDFYVPLQDRYVDISVSCDNPGNTITLLHRTSTSCSFHCWYIEDSTDNVYITYTFSEGNERTSTTNNHMDYSWTGTALDIEYVQDYSKFIYNSDIGYSTSDYRTLFHSYLLSEQFLEDAKAPFYVQTGTASSDISFALSNVKGYIQDSMFYASWTAPLGVGEDSGDMPVILDFVVVDLDSTETINASWVAYPPMDDSLPDSPYGTRITYYDVKDLGLSVDLTTVENLPTNYRIIGANLTPYYYRDLISLEGLSLCKGQTSMVALDYTGQYKNTIQVSPDDVIDAENTDLTIMGMISNFFSGFFNNFLDMLKRAFVPTTEDMNDLLGRMQAWFSDRLGFLWYPFDIAFDIVDALAEGERNSELKVPALVINLSSVGTYTIWEELTIDFDQMGIFEYVRFFTSCSLCCGVAVLAINKFDEWIGGHVHANGGDFWK